VPYLDADGAPRAGTGERRLRPASELRRWKLRRWIRADAASGAASGASGLLGACQAMTCLEVFFRRMGSSE
jgi:hypothetical protein